MLTVVLGLAVIAGFSVLSFWSSYAPFFMITGGISMMTGLKVYDVMTNDTGLAISLMLIGYAFVSMAMALKYMFWRGESE